MHYGHPDFMDGFWAANRGSVSKASPHINLSEDIFAGLNVKIRHQQSLHTDYLEWEKGREVQFLAGSGFFWKIASGSVGLLRTRDLRTLCGNASVMETFALYFATVAWHDAQVLRSCCAADSQGSSACSHKVSAGQPPAQLVAASKKLRIP